jgi:hypothetical protein
MVMVMVMMVMVMVMVMVVQQDRNKEAANNEQETMSLIAAGVKFATKTKSSKRFERCLDGSQPQPQQQVVVDRGR